MTKKVINILVAMALILTNAISSDVVKSCSDEVVTDFFPAGDSTGKSVLTQRETSRECNLTIEVQGPCIEWEEKNQRFGVDPTEYDSYRSNDNEEALGSLFATMGAYDQLEHLWSGWHGYCEIGTKTDFNWASDPMYWASLAASVAMDYATAGTGAAENGGTEAGNTAFGQASNSALNSATAAAESALTSVFYSMGIDLTTNMAKCLVVTGVDLAFAGVGAALEDNSDGDCDPVDEFCNEEVEIDEGDIFTMRVEQYNDLIADHPEAADYIVIIPPEENGIYTVRYLKPSEVEGSSEMSEEQTRKMKEAMAEMQLKIEVAMIAGSLAFCGVTGNASGPAVQGSKSDDSRASLENGVSASISAVPAGWMGPYGPLIKGASQVVLSIATSFKKINSCKNDEDSDGDGMNRHKKTYESLQYNLCHLASTTCAEEKVLLNGCALKGYNYCCYDQILTKVLVEQIKAQLGRDWAHCTGISIRDLKFVSFRECDDADRNANGGTLIDGANQENRFGFPGDNDVIYNPEDSYQFVRKCLDLKEFKDSIKKTFNQNIDLSDFEEDSKNLMK